jgi:hypothetical protein
MATTQEAREREVLRRARNGGDRDAPQCVATVTVEMRERCHPTSSQGTWQSRYVPFFSINQPLLLFFLCQYRFVGYQIIKQCLEDSPPFHSAFVTRSTVTTFNQWHCRASFLAGPEISTCASPYAQPRLPLAPRSALPFAVFLGWFSSFRFRISPVSISMKEATTLLGPRLVLCGLTLTTFFLCSPLFL